MNISNQTVKIPIGASEGCFLVEAVEDNIIEIEENFNLSFELTNPNDFIESDTNVTIAIHDNDGELGQYAHTHVATKVILCTGVTLIFQELIVILEGEMREICVVVDKESRERYRDSPVTIFIVPKSSTSGMSVYLCFIVKH